MSFDIVTNVYAQIWSLLEGDTGGFAQIVPAAQRVKINFSQVTPNSTQQAPVQYTAPESDQVFPQVSLLLGRFSHSGKAQSPRMGDNRGSTDSGRIRKFSQTFELIIIHKGFDVPTNSALKLLCINLIEGAPTGLGLLPWAGSSRVLNITMEPLNGRDEYGAWEGGSTLRNKTIIDIPVEVTFIASAFPTK